MNNEFEMDERFFRAIMPKDMYWKAGRPSSAAFKTSDPDGLSTDRQAKRSIADCVNYVHEHLQGRVVSVDYQTCQAVEVTAIYDPIETEEYTNPFHTLLRGKREDGQMKSSQAKRLAESCRVHDEG